MNGADWTGLFRRQSSRMKNRAAGDTKVITHRKLLSEDRSTQREGFISIFSCRCHFLFFLIFGLQPGDRNETNLATKTTKVDSKQEVLGRRQRARERGRVTEFT